MQVIVPGQVQQMLNLRVVLPAIGFMPAFDELHESGNHQAKDRDCTKCRQADASGEAVETAQAQNTGLFVEVLHGDGASGPHEVMPPVLQQGIHGYHQKTTQTT